MTYSSESFREHFRWWVLPAEKKYIPHLFMITSHLQTPCHAPDIFQPATSYLINYSSPHFHLTCTALFHISLPPCRLFHSLLSLSPLFFSSRIRQAKVQILPERILPDPLSAVQLTPLTRLHMHPSSKPTTQSCKKSQCWWTKYQQVRLTNTQTHIRTVQQS